MSYDPPNVQVGTIVHWLPCGNAHEKPIPAMVMEVTTPGTLVIRAQYRAGQKVTTAVRHETDPFLVTCSVDYRHSRGMWRLIPGSFEDVQYKSGKFRIPPPPPKETIKKPGKVNA